MVAVTSLFASVIDYAGLFPPAQLTMTEAVRRYAHYLTGPNRALLGAFVLPLARLHEFDVVFAQLPPAAQAGWRLNVLAGADPAADPKIISNFNAHPSGPRIVALETKAATPAETSRSVAALPLSVDAWIELPSAAPDLPSLIDAVRATGRGAKLRTGGVTANAFPSPAEVARFLCECHRAGVVMKATAGLHHPLRGDYPLTYEPGSPRGTMFGFLNVLLAAALVRAGGSAADTLALLDERDARAFTVKADEIAWRGLRFTAAQLAATRQTHCRSFGSCSFTEPIAGLQELSWL